VALRAEKERTSVWPKNGRRVAPTLFLYTSKTHPPRGRHILCMFLTLPTLATVRPDQPELFGTWKIFLKLLALPATAPRGVSEVTSGPAQP